MKNNRGLALSGVVASALVLAGWLVFLLIINLIPESGGLSSPSRGSKAHICAARVVGLCIGVGDITRQPRFVFKI